MAEKTTTITNPFALAPGLKKSRSIQGRIPPQYQPAFARKRLEDNILRMLLFSIGISLAMLLFSLVHRLMPERVAAPVGMACLSALLYVSLGVSVVYGALFMLARRGTIQSPRVQAALVQSMLYLTVAIQLAYTVLCVYSSGFDLCFLITVFILGFVAVVSPRQCAASIALTYGVLWTALFLARDTSSAWYDVMLTDTWANLLIIGLLAIGLSAMTYRKYIDSFLKDIALEEANGRLEEMVQARTEALRAQTLKAQAASRVKSDFLAKMSHEIRTPLNAIIGMTRIARKNAVNPEARHALNETDKASAHLLDLLNDILDMSNIEAGCMELAHEPFALCAALEEVAATVSARVEESGQSFAMDARALGCPTVVGDRARLKQVLLNLLDNAIKFTPEGGHITLLVTADAETDDSLRATFSIEDDGIGIRPDQLPRLFDTFEQPDQTLSLQLGGTGLGLPISQNLIESMGGHIAVSSLPGQGSTFQFTLTLEKVATLGEGDASPLEIPNLAGRHILVVEDIEINRSILLELLRDTGASFDEATDGRDGVEKFAASPEGYYDFVFMDIQMPRMDGYEATRAIRALPRGDAHSTPIYAMTANAYPEDIAKATASGMDGHLSKPVDLSAVLRTLRRRVR